MGARDTTAGERRLFLRATPASRDRAVLHAELDPADASHALQVLRLAPGDVFVGVDGRGGAWRCRLGAASGSRARGGAVAIEVLELTERAPEPGSAGAEPRVVLHVAWPRPGPAEEMLDRLAQLGVAVIVPLVTERSGPHARELAGQRRTRAERILREALKQCGRLWLPELAPARELAELLGTPLPAASAVLDPGGTEGLVNWMRATPARELALFVGPEGGWTDAERAALAAAGTRACRLARHVLRIETAAEAAAAVVAALDVERGE